MLRLLLPALLLLPFNLSNAAGEGIGHRGTEKDEAYVLSVEAIHKEFGLDGQLEIGVFMAGYEKVIAQQPEATMFAIADMSQPSTAKRLYVIDLKTRKLILRTYVAHGQKTGELMATSFSNEHDSHKTSLGLYRIGARITSPKHGAALLLHGLEAELNGNAMAREVIMHGADYVSEDFIKANGRLGRSWGCPAVSRADMATMIELFANGGSLYIHG